MSTIWVALRLAPVKFADVNDVAESFAPWKLTLLKFPLEIAPAWRLQWLMLLLLKSLPARNPPCK